MYRIDHPNAQTMVVRFVPWTQRAIGLFLVLAGAAILLLPFPTVARLRCDREQDACTLEQTNLVRARLVSWRASDLTGARLEEVASEGAAYRIWVSMREGEQAFTPYSIGGSWRAKLAVVAQVRAYARDPSVKTLDVIEDERPLFYAFAAGTTVLGLVVLIFVRTVICQLDIRGGRFHLRGNDLWGLGGAERPLAELVEAIVEPQDGWSHRVAFRFSAGPPIPLTYYRYPGRADPAATALAVNAFLKDRRRSS